MSAKTDYRCYVCGETIEFGDPHTYHAEGCERRDYIHQDLDVRCAGLPGCGEDVHPECCPSCTGQAF